MDPFINLALEDYLFNSMPTPSTSSEVAKKDQDARRLLLYVNRACAVIGRNQNPWRECDVPTLRNLGLPLVRRKSGGGAVVHDTGNVNFSVMVPRSNFHRAEYAQMVVDSVNCLPSEFVRSMDGEQTVVKGPQFKLEVNQRGDIIAAGSGEKVSGSAYKIVREKAYHHGTFLLNSNLDMLRKVLHKSTEGNNTIEGRGTESVKSLVKNVGLDKNVFITSLVTAFKYKHLSPEQPIDVVQVREQDLPEEVTAVVDELKSWTFSQTPEFVQTFELKDNVVLKFHVSKGCLKNIEYDPTLDLEQFDQGLYKLNDLIKNQDVEYQKVYLYSSNLYIKQILEKSI